MCALIRIIGERERAKDRLLLMVATSLPDQIASLASAQINFMCVQAASPYKHTYNWQITSYSDQNTACMNDVGMHDDTPTK